VRDRRWQVIVQIQLVLAPCVFAEIFVTLCSNVIKRSELHAEHDSMEELAVRAPIFVFGITLRIFDKLVAMHPDVLACQLILCLCDAQLRGGILQGVLRGPLKAKYLAIRRVCRIKFKVDCLPLSRNLVSDVDQLLWRDVTFPVNVCNVARSTAARVKVVVASVMQPMAEYRFALNVV
jgi:hypothetical protein